MSWGFHELKKAFIRPTSRYVTCLNLIVVCLHSAKSALFPTDRLAMLQVILYTLFCGCIVHLWLYTALIFIHCPRPQTRNHLSAIMFRAALYSGPPILYLSSSLVSQLKSL